MFKKTNLLTLFIFAVTAFMTTTAYAIPQQPHAILGTALLDGVRAPDGTLVQALIDGVVYDDFTVQNVAGYDANFQLQIAADDPDTPLKDGGTDGDTIVFKIGDYVADQTATWSAGASLELDLTAGGSVLTAAFSCTPTSGVAPLTVTCTDESTGDPTSWAWDLGGTQSSVQNPSHTFTTLGTHFVSLTVSNGAQSSEPVTQEITVSDGDMNLTLSPDVVDVFMPLPFTLGLQINDAAALYGTEINCTYDTAFLIRQDVTWPLFFETDELAVNNSANGEITLAASQKNPAAALEGSGQVGDITFSPQQSGQTTVTCEWEFFNKEGQPIASGTADTTINILAPLGGVNGTFVHQLRSPHDGIAVAAIADGATQASTITSDGGGFTIDDLTSGNYDLMGQRIGHLDYCHNDVVVPEGETVTLPLVKLEAGDTDADRDVDLDDALAISGDFGDQTTNLSRDFNANGKIDGGDLTALGGNYNTISNCD